VLLAGLGASTFPLAFAGGVPALAALAFACGLLTAPTVTASIDQISRLVPEGARGEAIGWHGSAMTAGNSIGAPIAGVAIDGWGFAGGFVVIGIVGTAVAVALGLATSRNAPVSMPVGADLN
jgi:predicted MFS family arabinose efflux permease